jgi:hypothetical protein
MPLRTLLILFLRGIAVWLFIKSLGSFLMLSVAGASVLSHPDTPYDTVSLIYVNLAHSLILLAGGVLLFRFDGRIAGFFGRGLALEERVGVLDSDTLIRGIYAIIGVWLLVFSVPEFAGNLIKMQSGYYTLSSSDADRFAAVFRASIVEDGFRILAGCLLIRFAKKPPAFLSHSGEA